MMVTTDQSYDEHLGVANFPIDDDLAAVAQSRDDHLGLDHVNKTRVLGDSIFIR